METISNNITSELFKNTPLYKNSDSIDRYLNAEIKELQKIKSKLLSRIHRLKHREGADETHLAIFKNTLKEVKLKLNTKFNKEVNKFWTNKIRKIDTKNSETMFPQMNSFFRSKSNSNIPNLIIEKNNINLFNREVISVNRCVPSGNEIIISDPQDKANVLAKYLADINNMNRKSISEPLERIVDNKVNEFLRLNYNDNPLITFSKNNSAIEPKYIEDQTFFCTLKKFKIILKKLNNKKSTGIDKIPNIALKNLLENYIQYILTIFNNLLNNGYFPDRWKKAKVIPLPKKGKDPSRVSSYRPISLLPNLGKLFEILINNSLTTQITLKNCIPKEQFGFRLRSSTIHAVTKFVSDISNALSKNNIVAACLIDLEKAFDSVWLRGLMFKLIKKNLPEHLLRMVWSMIIERKMSVSISGGIESNEYILKNGLQQGAVNSPILFNLYLSEILELFGINSTEGIGFADDLVLYIKGKILNLTKEKLENIFRKICNFFSTWKLKCNFNKCETILFRPLLEKLSKKFRKNWKDFEISANDTDEGIINHKRVVKYLGIFIDDRLKYLNHINISLEKAKNAFFKYKNIFYSSKLNHKVKLICYQILIRPILAYGCQIWFGIFPSTMEKIRVFERNCL